jgi:hypothetical protein
MEKEKSLNILNSCLNELESISQEEFDKRSKLHIIIGDNVNCSCPDDSFAIIWDCSQENK